MVISDNLNSLQSMLEELNSESRKAGMEINFDKTKILSNKDSPFKITIGNETKEKVDNIIYLGQLISFQK